VEWNREGDEANARSSGAWSGEQEDQAERADKTDKADAEVREDKEGRTENEREKER